MKKTALLCILFFSLMQAVAQIAENKELYERKVHTYYTMRRTGTVLTLVGAGMLGLGIVQYNNSMSTTNSNTGPNEGGPALAFLGGGVVSCGLTFWIIGGIKQKKYKQKLSTTTLSIAPQPRGLTLRLRF
jgi:hypothetical protein